MDELKEIIYKAHKGYWGDYTSGLGLYERIAQAVLDAGYVKMPSRSMAKRITVQVKND